MTSRKSIAAALLAQLTQGGQFIKSGRRDRAPEQAAAPNAPGFYLLKPRETYRYSDDAERGLPPVRELLFFALIYTDVGSNASAVPADVIDDLLDAVDQALAPSPTDQITNGGRQTLGGLVYDCRIDGEVECAPGDLQGKGQTLVPIKVTLNQYP
jgi:hypothetical protein